jgi:hypothetical protein
MLTASVTQGLLERLARTHLARWVGGTSRPCMPSDHMLPRSGALARGRRMLRMAGVPGDDSASRRAVGAQWASSCGRCSLHQLSTCSHAAAKDEGCYGWRTFRAMILHRGELWVRSGRLRVAGAVCTSYRHAPTPPRGFRLLRTVDIWRDGTTTISCIVASGGCAVGAFVCMCNQDMHAITTCALRGAGARDEAVADGGRIDR